MRRLGLRAKAAALFTLSTLLIGSAAASIVYSAADAALREAAAAEVGAVAEEKDAALAGIFAEALREVALLAENDRIVAAARALRSPAGRAGTVASARADLARRVVVDGPFTGAFLLDASSAEVLVATDDREEGQFRETQPYFREGLRGPYVQNPYYSVTLRGPAMTAAAPVRAGTEVVAILGARVGLDRVQRILSRGAHPTSDAYLVDRAGLLVTQPRSAAEGASLRLSARTAEIEGCVAGTRALGFTVDHRGTRVLASFSPLSDRQLCLVTTVDEAEALQAARALGARITVIVIVATILFSGLGLVVADSVVRPVAGLRSAVARVANGDLTASVPAGPEDEIGQLAREFDRMRLALARNERDLASRAARLAEANAELESFSYSVAHDLRAPLRTIDGFARALVEDHSASLDDEAKRFLDRITSGAARMAALIDDLLRLSRVSRSELRPSPVDVTRMATDLADELCQRDPGRRVEVTIAPGMRVVADPALAHLAISNLFENAWKFTRPRDGARIEVRGEQRDGTTWIVVRDNGVGFDPAHGEQLFSPFHRLHSTAEFPGTGIGLATVRRIAARHGGAVWAEGVVGQGAQFGMSFGGAA